MSRSSSKEGVARFTSDAEFKAYVESGKSIYSYYAQGIGERTFDTTEMQNLAPSTFPSPTTAETGPMRVSETNVQVAGIDEPDIVKTDGTQIYFSGQQYLLYKTVPTSLVTDEQGFVPPSYETGKTNVISAFPPEDLAKIATIDKTGNLLLSGNILVIFSGTTIYGFDVSDPSAPSQKWTIEFKDNVSSTQARLFRGKIYLVTQTSISSSITCPIEIMSTEKGEVAIPCTDIYHPITPLSVDVTYTVSAINPANGNVENSVSFVGSSSSSVIFMSENALYVTYSYSEDLLTFYEKFLKEKALDLVSSTVIDRIAQLKEYDISSQSKLTELGLVLEEYKNSLSASEQSRIENELGNRMNEYVEEHNRELGKSGIVKIGLSDFKVLAEGNVPGRVFNQFSLDEYNGFLRVATTVGESTFGGSGETVNDVYVLDETLNVTGFVQDLGKGERIYSARFIADKGYVVTFKQTDPFYVLDLSDPKNPILSGELKIPGFSSYLHPISGNTVLGIGQENWQVKLALFDVSDPENPQEASKYLLDEYWTEVQNNHHAFLLDSKNEIFFLPGGKGGYIFSYTGNELVLKKVAAETQAKRAVYIDDYLYIIGESKITVLSETDLSEVKTLEL